MNRKFLIIFACLSFFNLNAQDFSEAESNLAYLNDIMANAYEYKHKVKAGNEFNFEFKKVLTLENSFTHPFSSLKWISIKKAENNTFRIITWFLETSEKTFQNYGIIQFANGNTIELNDNSDNITDLEYEVLSASNWYGALYYNMMYQKYDGKDLYLLFGYNPGNKNKKIKVLDVLTFDGEEPIFGKEIFKEVDNEKRTLYKNRIALNYSASSNVNLNYNEGLDLILYDNLIATITPEEGPTSLPDGSYKAYKKDGDEWLYVDKVFDLISETPPTDGRKDRQKGLFKKEKKR